MRWGKLWKTGNRCPAVAIKCRHDDRCECGHNTTGKMTWKHFQALNGIRTHDLCVICPMLSELSCQSHVREVVCGLVLKVIFPVVLWLQSQYGCIRIRYHHVFERLELTKNIQADTFLTDSYYICKGLFQNVPAPMSFSQVDRSLDF